MLHSVADRLQDREEHDAQLVDFITMLSRSKASDIVVDGFERDAEFPRNALGFLIVGQDAREHEADDEDGSGNGAGEQRVEGQEFEPGPVNDGLTEAEQENDDDHGRKQHEFLADPSRAFLEKMLEGIGWHRRRSRVCGRGEHDCAAGRGGQSNRLTDPVAGGAVSGYPVATGGLDQRSCPS